MTSLKSAPLKTDEAQRQRRAPGRLFSLSLSLCFLFTSLAWADLAGDMNSEEERLKGFQEHQKENQSFDQDRLSGLAEYRKRKKKWEEEQARTLPAFKAEKAKEAAALDETSPEYRLDLMERYLHLQRLELARRRYVQIRDWLNARIKRSVFLTANQEYFLSETPRVDFANRYMYGGKAPYGFKVGSQSETGSGGTGSAGGSNSFSPGGTRSNIPSGGEFFDSPMIPPPPPPPPPPMYDDQVPPPMFDEPDF